MDCFTETIASLWIVSLKYLGARTHGDEDDDSCVQENLEQCRCTLEKREMELAESCKRLGKEALRKRQQGDEQGVRMKLLDRRRAIKRLEKLRSSISLVDAQLETLKTTELDRELMRTLIASSTALKRAGVGKGVKEAETIMSELDEQMRESSELTSVLAAPLDESFDVDAEMEELEQECNVRNALFMPNGEITQEMHVEVAGENMKINREAMNREAENTKISRATSVLLPVIS
jgi:Snf7